MRLGLDHDIPLRTFLAVGEDLTILKPDFDLAYIRAISKLSGAERENFHNAVSETGGLSDHPPTNEALGFRALFGHIF